WRRTRSRPWRRTKSPPTTSAWRCPSRRTTWATRTTSRSRVSTRTRPIRSPGRPPRPRPPRTSPGWRCPPPAPASTPPRRPPRRAGNPSWPPSTTSPRPTRHRPPSPRRNASAKWRTAWNPSPARSAKIRTVSWPATPPTRWACSSPGSCSATAVV
ncbi:MAG: hypothetical protein AVDCRST_MAG68-938, partial [uncultured Gemmatimonadetes bacterium]